MAQSGHIIQIFKSRQNILELLEEQGYNVDEYKGSSINEVNSMYQEKQMDMLVNKSSGKKTYIKYHLANLKGSGGSLRANNIYEAPRELIKKLDAELVEMKRCKAKGLCCGAGGAQMFKDPEPGKIEINIKRTEEALETNPNIIAAACPFCNTMMSDGIKNKEKDKSISVKDIAELICDSKKL